MANAAEYYQFHKYGLGFEFLKEVEHTIEKIHEFPQSGIELRNGIRRRLVRRFPFGVLYKPDKSKIVVVAVMHLRRNPNYWYKRLNIIKRSS